MQLPQFQYLSPASLGEALDLLARDPGASAALAGGTDLLLAMRQRLAVPAAVIGISRLTVPKMKRRR